MDKKKQISGVTERVGCGDECQQLLQEQNGRCAVKAESNGSSPSSCEDGREGSGVQTGADTKMDTPTRPKDRSLCETLEYMLEKRPELGALIDELKLEFV